MRHRLAFSDQHRHAHLLANGPQIPREQYRPQKHGLPMWIIWHRLRAQTHRQGELDYVAVAPLAIGRGVVFRVARGVDQLAVNLKRHLSSGPFWTPHTE